MRFRKNEKWKFEKKFEKMKILKLELFNFSKFPNVDSGRKLDLYQWWTPVVRTDQQKLENIDWYANQVNGQWIPGQRWKL